MIRRSIIISSALGIAALWASPSSAQVQSLDLRAPFGPVVADPAGEKQLVYELHLTNFALQALVIDRIEVIDQSSNQAIWGAEGKSLEDLLGRAGRRGKEDLRIVDPGARTIAYFNLPLGGRPLRTLVHRIEFRFAGGDDLFPKQMVSDPVAVDSTPPISLGPPLKGGPWAAVYAPEMERGHRRVIYATSGTARIPGRFAIDWIKLDQQGQQAPKGATRLDQFYGHGSEVLAVADATVASVRDDVAEAETLDVIPEVSIADASGNYVALDLGGGRYAFYEHLQPGVRVRPGQRVKRGDVIGRLGLTGQGSSPHLHFHVANANSLLSAEGLPFVMTGMEILGSYASIDAFGQGGPWIAASKPDPKAPFAPTPSSVVRFVGTAR